MDLSDIDILKKLDDIDSKEYSGSRNAKVSRKDSTTSEMNFDDFDAPDDDDDLADLLYDDDNSDAVKNKNKSPKQAQQNPSTIKSESPKKKLFGGTDDGGPFGKKANPTAKCDSPFGEGSTKKEVVFDKSVTRDLVKKVPDSPNKSTPSKKMGKSKIDLFLEEEEKYLGELGVDQLENLSSTSGFSNEKAATPPAKQNLTSKGSIDVQFDDDDDDVLNSLDDTSSPSKNKRKSFLDDLVKKDEPKPVLKKMSSIFNVSPEKSANKKDDDDDVMVYGSYLPSARSTSKPSGRQGVKFEDDARAPISPPSKPSPVKVMNSDDTVRISRRPRAEILRSAPSSDRAGIFDNKLDHVLKSPTKQIRDIFSNSPAKDPDVFQPRPSLRKSLEQGDKLAFKPSTASSARRESTSDWLGLGSSEKNPQKPIIEYKKEEMNRQETKIDTAKSNPSNEMNSQKGRYPWLSDSPAKDKPKISDPASSSEPVAEKQKVEHAMMPAKNNSFVEPTEFSMHPVSHSTPESVSSKPVTTTMLPEHSENKTPNIIQSIPESILQNISQTVSQMVIQQNTPLKGPQITANSSSENESNIAALQALVSSLQFERDQMLKSAEMMTKRKEEDSKTFEESLKKQQKDLEETMEKRMKSIQEEHEVELRKSNKELEILRDERKVLGEENRSKVQKLDDGHDREIKKLKEFHSEAIAMLKKDHEESISRMNKLRDQEIEAITSTQVQTKSLQLLSDQLESRASELAALQLKLEERHHNTVKEKESLFATKEKDLKILEGRLQWQMEEGDHERTRLQQLVLRLENRLNIQTKDSEEERWNVQQLKTKLEVQQRFLEEERKAMTESVEREKDKMRLSQNSLLQEQKAMIGQLAQERQQLCSDRLQLEQLSKRVREEEARLTARQLREESSIQSQRRMLDEESEKLHLDKELLKQEMLQIRSERNAFDREQRQLKDEKEKLHDAKLELKRKTEEAVHLAMKAASERDESRDRHTAAQRIEADHHSRMNQFTDQMQALMEKEKGLLLEREKIAEEARQFERTRSSALCANCKLAIGLPVMSLPPTIGTIQQQHPTPVRFGLSGQSNPATVDPGLMVWYVTAQKDHDYIEEQLSFMRDLEDRRKK